MKNISQKILVAAVVLITPVAVMAQTRVNPTDLVSQMQTLLDQYSEKIRILEAENQLLRNMMAKHEIQIPLEEFTKIYNTTGATTIPTTPTSQSSVSTSASATTPTTTTTNSSLAPLQKGFIDQFLKDWPNIRTAYQLPANAWVGGYEFVKNDAGNNVFVGIVYGSGTTEGAFNAKLLYEFDKTNFGRKLVGLFEYNTQTKVYVTRRGTNPFANVPRDFIWVGRTGNIISQTNTASSPSWTTTSTTNVSTNSTPTQTTTGMVNANIGTPSATTVAMENEITKLYQDKKYNEVMSTSDNYLRSNAPTYRILQLRYRSLFVLREFNKALAEVQKMEDAKLATAFSYCEAYAIAMHANNQTLANKYKGLAGAGCSTTGS